MRITDVRTWQVKVDGTGRTLVPEGHSGFVSIEGTNMVLWFGRKKSLTDPAGEADGPIIISWLFGSTTRDSRQLIAAHREEDGDVAGVGHPSVIRLDEGLYVFYSRTDRSGLTSLWRRSLVRAGEVWSVGVPELVLHPADAAKQLGLASCSAIRKMRICASSGGELSLFDYVEPGGRSGIGYSLPGLGLYALLTVIEDRADGYSTASHCFMGPDGYTYIAYSRREGGVWSAWLGRLVSHVGGLVLEPAIQLVNLSQGGDADVLVSELIALPGGPDTLRLLIRFDCPEGPCLASMTLEF